MIELPAGYSFKKTRGGLVAIHDENDFPLLYGLSEESVLGCLPHLHGPTGRSHADSGYQL